MQLLFLYLSGFTQLNQSIIIAVDNGNSCLRMVDRTRLYVTSMYVGVCLVAGFADGPNALFNQPWAVIKDAREDRQAAGDRQT